MVSGTKKILLDNKRYFIIKLIISVFLRISLLIIPICYSKAIDQVTIGDFDAAYITIIALLIISILFRLLEMVNQKSYQVLYNGIYYGFFKKALDLTKKNSIYSLSRISLSEYSNILTNDINIISDFYSTMVIRIVQAVELVFIIVYFFVINFYVGIVTLILIVCLLIMLMIWGKKNQIKNEKAKQNNDVRIGVIQELFTGVKEIKGFHLFNKIKYRILGSNEKYLSDNQIFVNSQSYLKHTTLLFIEAFRALALLFCVYLVFNKSMTIGTVLLIYSYYTKLSESFNDSIVNINDMIRNYKISIKRFYRLIEFSSNSTSECEEIDKMKRGTIDFDGVLYGKKEDPILNNATLHIKPNKITVITGPSASGKTGIFDLLLKLNKQHYGEILIDKVNIERYSDENYFELISAARKNPSFFTISIRENLKLIQSDFEEITQICSKLKIHDDILNLPNGYETILTSNGSNLPSELRYKLSIVRVLLKNSKIMLFDECMNAFNKTEDLKLMDIFEEYKHHHTIVIISKEKHIIERADEVIMMDAGRVVGVGTYDKLITSNEFFQKFYKGL